MEEKKNNKGVIWLIIILIVLVLGVASYIVYEKFIKVDVEYGTKEEIIKQNFLNDIKLVKKGKGTEKQNYLLCSDIYNCENIDEFNIDNIHFFENGEDNKPVYKIKLSWNCKGDGECFYNEQYGYNDATKLNEIETFYKVDENNKIIECLGNSYDSLEEETGIELKDLEFPTKNDTSVIVYGDIHEYLNSEDKQKIMDLVNNYQNITLTKQNIIFNFSCSDYNLEEQFCYEETININNKFNISFSLDRGSSEQTFFLITNKYIIVQKSNSAIMDGNIEIYDYDGKLLKTIENTTNYLVVHGEHCEYLYGGDISYNVRLVNNKLHYIDSSATYKTLDLDNFEENVISLINASTSQQC